MTRDEFEQESNAAKVREQVELRLVLRRIADRKGTNDLFWLPEPREPGDDHV